MGLVLVWEVGMEKDEMRGLKDRRMRIGNIGKKRV